MQIAIVLYDHVTALDVIGPYEVFGRLPGADVTLVGERTGPVTTDTGTPALHAYATLDEVTRPDTVVVPGGPGQLAHMADGPIQRWLRQVDQTTTWTTSVCTGALILASAGLLENRRATTHWLAKDQLAELGAIPTDERVVFDGKYVTAAGVSSGIDMALTLIDRMFGDLASQAVQLGIEYDPQPPYDAGHPDKAPEAVVALLRNLRDQVLFGAPNPATPGA